MTDKATRALFPDETNLITMNLSTISLPYTEMPSNSYTLDDLLRAEIESRQKLSLIQLQRKKLSTTMDVSATPISLSVPSNYVTADTIIGDNAAISSTTQTKNPNFGDSAVQAAPRTVVPLPSSKGSHSYSELMKLPSNWKVYPLTTKHEQMKISSTEIKSSLLRSSST